MIVFWALLSGFCFGLADLLTRLGVRSGTPYTGATVSSVGTLVPLLLILWVRGIEPGPLWPAIGWFCLTGAAGLAPGKILYYTSIRRLGVSRAAVFNSVSPFFGILIGVTLLGETPTWNIPLGAFFIFGGVVALLADRSAARLPSGAAFIGFIPALFFTLMPVFMRMGIQALPDVLFGSAILTATALVVLLLCSSTIPSDSRWRGDGRAIWMFILAGLSYAAAYLTYYQALWTHSVSFVMPLVYTSPLFSILLSRLFVQRLEQVNRQLVVGAIAVFIGVVLVSVSRGG